MYNAKAGEAAHVAVVLDEVRSAISADNNDLRETRKRRDLVLSAAKSFPGVLRTFISGSVAHGTVNRPIDDADGGAVLDRRAYPDLGPDSSEEGGPEPLMRKLRDHIMVAVQREYPQARSRLTKRAILIEFNKPNSDGVDPSVDVIAALTRKDAVGLWIPNRESGGWNASHPEEHTRLLTAKPKDLRVHRARLIRLVKAAIKKDSTPALVSFNVEALSLEIVEEVEEMPEALQAFFAEAAASIKAGYTEDPAGVSGKIKLRDGMSRSRAASRLGFFAEKVQEAIDAESREDAEAALAELYPDELPNARKSAKKSVAEALDSGDEGKVRKAFAVAPAAAVKPKMRSYGDDADAA
ncbi:MAG TPA: hypothetical protein VHI77_03710 [Solirubrobacterales bacterium]|jgi:hypothetical protein|nr:hypothetical protein [Solirubrobacterales bacterium]